MRVRRYLPIKKIMITTNNKQQINSLVPNFSFAWYYTGFAHSDGSLNFAIEKNSSFLGFRIVPVFGITLGILSKDLIFNIANFLGCGNIVLTKTQITYKVTDFKHIWNIIIPHFLNYPFSGRKFLVFKIFVVCCSLLYPFYNKSLPYWISFKIVYLSFLMNDGSKRTFEELKKYLLIIQAKAIESGKLSNKSVYLTDDLIDLLNINKNKILNINIFPTQFQVNPNNYNLIAQYPYITLTYILGVFEGDGSFYIKFLSSNSIYTFGFSITTSIDDLHILILIRLKLGCGKIEIKSKTWCRLEISRMDDLKNIIIPLVDSLKIYRKNEKDLLSSKAALYAIWKKGLIKHLNKEFAYKTAISKTEKQIKKIALINFINSSYNIHNKGQKRKYNLNQFLELHNLKKD